MIEGIKKFFAYSETIFLARVNGLVGFLMSITSLVDPSLLEPILTPQVFSGYVLFNAVLTEIARRLRAPNLGETK